MFKRVDDGSPQEQIEGYSYLNKTGDIEKVVIYNTNIITIYDGEGDTVNIYTEDIPKLIKALQAAYDHKD